jgi:hypothetical protein
VSSRIRHARPFRVRAPDADAYSFGVTPSVMMCFRKELSVRRRRIFTLLQ